MTTVPFGPRNREQDPLLARAAELPKDVAPPRDLWPAIAARLAATPQRAGWRAPGWLGALAAGFVVASVSALLTWGLMREPDPAVVENPAMSGATTAATIMPVQYGPNSPLGAAELTTRDELLVQFRQRLDELSPQTREAVVKNLAIIQRAVDEIDAALAQDPASGLLNELLLGAYKQELQLYSRRT
ncbi:MAG: hypothetical protein OEW16_12845 [Gammaproteobacteria bacterium]|nr:hypothetical protein [Gammaproteobacteria bacterium]